ncbi:hypothetical protein [Dyadobacter sp. 676]|uniref:Chromate transporter n=1 Tax=Dyadobacter sp. 676 TaxID=3088362 RepID=A0AAU8FR05_9BACT
MASNLPFEKKLEPIFIQKFPALPDSTKELFVRYGPYVLLAACVTIVVVLLAAIGIMGASAGFGAVSIGMGFNFYVSVFLGLVALVMSFLAFTPLRSRKKSGWKLIYYALLFGLGSSLFELNVFVFLVAGLLGFWVLFQIREKYF